MATKAERARNWARLGAFYCGLCVIAAAAILNIVYDRLSGPQSLPPFLANMYSASGKTGVTLTFVFMGLSIMLLGLAVPRVRRDPQGSHFSGMAVPLFTPPDGSESEPSVTVYGRVVLRTQKYLQGQYGTPAAAVPQKPQ